MDYLVLLFLYYVLNLNLELATAIGFIVGFAISFTANRQWVFGSQNHKKRLPRQITEYVLLVIFNFLFTILAVSFLNSHGVKPFIGKLLVMGLIMCWNYALFRWVIFVSDEPAKV
ncbi:GtrA family protein [Candidatus Saccharibacteria bacterium]|nr:GtrA family protein [Candidatus Saccharibacteria bacterium]